MTETVKNIFNKKWSPLNFQLSALENSHYPGIYLLAWTDKDLTGENIKLEDVFYVGMSNARKGLSSRVREFLKGLENGKVHSAATRFFKIHCNGVCFSQSNHTKKFYIIGQTFTCNVFKETRTSDDLRLMGDICQLEYYLLAQIKETTGKEPELNKK